MIFNYNRIDSIVESEGVVDRNYLGTGALNFMQEAAEDELDIFTMAIKSDMEETMIGESSDLEFLNESFVENIVSKIKEIWRKFKNWVVSFTKSVVDKFYNVIMKDNTKFCKRARKYIPSQLKADYKYNGKVLNFENLTYVSEEPGTIRDYMETIINENADMDEAKSNMEKKAKELKDKFTEDTKDDKLFKSNTNANSKVIVKHIEFLERNTKNAINGMKTYAKESIKLAKNEEAYANKILKAYNKTDDVDEKNKLTKKAFAATRTRECVQFIMNGQIRVLKKQISVARAVVNSAMSASKAKLEGFGYDADYVNAVNESYDYELESMLEEVSEYVY